MDIAYGIDILPENDPYVDVAAKAVAMMASAAIPGAHIVDSLPICAYPPTTFQAVQLTDRFWLSQICSELVPWCGIQAQSERMQETGFRYEGIALEGG